MLCFGSLCNEAFSGDQNLFGYEERFDVRGRPPHSPGGCGHGQNVEENIRVRVGKNIGVRYCEHDEKVVVMSFREILWVVVSCCEGTECRVCRKDGVSSEFCTWCWARDHDETSVVPISSAHRSTKIAPISLFGNNPVTKTQRTLHTSSVESAERKVELVLRIMLRSALSTLDLLEPTPIFPSPAKTSFFQSNLIFWGAGGSSRTGTDRPGIGTFFDTGGSHGCHGGLGGAAVLHRPTGASTLLFPSPTPATSSTALPKRSHLRHTSFSESPTFMVVSGMTAKKEHCLAADAPDQEGSGLTIVPCEAGVRKMDGAELWRFMDNGALYTLMGKKCLSLVDGETKGGGTIELQDCDKAAAAGRRCKNYVGKFLIKF